MKWLPPSADAVARRLIGMTIRRSSISSPWNSWYRASPPTTPARNASLRDPPTALPARLRSSSGTSNVPRLRASVRARVRCECGVVRGRQEAGDRPADERRRDRWPRCGGWRVRPSPCHTSTSARVEPCPCHGAVGGSRDLSTRSVGPNVGMASTRSSGASSPGSRSKSNSIKSSFIPPTPSVIEWCTFITIAARPPSRPSTSVYSHRGRERSKPAIAAVRAMSSTASVGLLAGPDPAEVVREIEVGVARPVRRSHAQEWRRHALAHPGDEPGTAFDATHEGVPVRRRDRRTAP